MSGAARRCRDVLSLGEHLLTAGGEPGGLSAAYYGNGNLSGPAVLRTDPEIDFDWGRERPRALAESVLPENLPERTYTVSLYFAEPKKLGPGERVFSVKVQGEGGSQGFRRRQAGGRGSTGAWCGASPAF